MPATPACAHSRRTATSPAYGTPRIVEASSRRTRAFLTALVLAVLAALLTGCSSPREGALGALDIRTTTHLGGWLSLDDTLRHATGQAQWSWTSPMRTCSLVLQSPVNAPVSAANGSGVWVDAVDVEGHARPVQALEPTGPGRALYYRVPLRTCLEAGEEVHFVVRFRAYAGAGGVERVGFHHAISWWGSVVPQPAYATGSGWVTPPGVRTKGESTTSQVFATTGFRVDVPSTARVAAPGLVRRLSSMGGRDSWMLTTGLVRDLALVTGAFVDVSAGAPGCRIRALAPPGPGAAGRARAIATAAAADLRQLKGHFLFCPYPTVTVAAVAGPYGGMEFPGLVVVAEHDPVASPRLVAHELGHQYFYAFAGSNPGQAPWLDEALATYSDALVNPSSAASLLQQRYPASVRGHLGEPMSYWDAHPAGYTEGVYAQGANALLRARAHDGDRRLDAALRHWLAACGQRVCDSARFRTVLAQHSPAAVRELAAAGAWPER